jgi:homoserine kinase type II
MSDAADSNRESGGLEDIGHRPEPSVSTVSPAASGSWPTLPPSAAASGLSGAPSSPTSPVRATFEAGELAMVVSRYDIGVIESVKEFRRGSGRAPKVVLKTDRGRYLLKRRRVGREGVARVRFCHEIQVHLAARRFPLPKLIASKTDGQTLLVLDDFVYELFEFIPGDHYDQSLDATADAGRALGLFHRLLAGFRSPAFSPTTASYHNAAGLEEHLARVEQQLSEPAAAAIVKRLRTSYADAAQRAEELGVGSWPRQIVHGDWHPGNMLFRGSRVSAVIDYDTARSCPRVIDIANGAMQFSITMQGQDPDRWPTSLDEGRFKRFCRGYETVPDCVISTAELEAIPWLMIEALIVEAIIPIAATGSFAGLSGVSFLRMADAKTAWLQQYAARLAAMIGD